MTKWFQLDPRHTRLERLAHVTRAARTLATTGLVHCVADDEVLTGRTISLEGKRLLHFGNCSYLGLEVDPRLKAAACQAIERYGTQFSSSRTFCSAPLYRTLEARFSDIVGGHPLVIAPTTTLAHSAALPAIVDEGDVVLFDRHVHNSVQTALRQLGLADESCYALPHNRLDLLAEELTKLAPSGRRVFYLCDGVYSMQGDLLDVAALHALLDRFPFLHVYVDDAHGVGWTGRRGAGVVLGHHELHPRMVVVLGLAKGFGSAGAVLVARDPLVTQRVFSCGSGLVFSGPITPAQLGAGVAAADILLSDELPRMQGELAALIDAFDQGCRELGLPVAPMKASPIRFIPVGDERETIGLGHHLRERGCFTNLALFPAVPLGRAGIRIVLTRHLQLDDVRQLLSALHEQRSSASPLSLPAA